MRTSIKLDRELILNLVTGGSGTIALMVTNKVLVIITSIVIARLLGPNQYGNYAFIISILGILVIFGQLGFHQLMVRETSVAIRRKNYSQLMGLVKTSTIVTLSLSIIICVLCAFLIRNVDIGRGISKETFYWSLPLLPIVVLASLRDSVLRGLGRVVTAKIPELILSPIFLLGLIASFYFLFERTEMSDKNVIQLRIYAQFTALLIGSWLLVRSMPDNVGAVDSEYKIQAWVVSSFPFLVISLAQALIQNTDIIMLGMFRSSSETGIYSVATRATAFIPFVLIAVNTVIGPRIARLYDSGEMIRLQRMLSLGALISFFGALPIVLVFVFYGDIFLKILYGDEFTRGHIAIKILSIGHLLNVAIGSVALILNMTGFAWYTSLGVVIAAIANIILNYVLIPVYGIAGAAFATCISIVLWNFLLAYWVYTRAGIRSTVLSVLYLKNDK